MTSWWDQKKKKSLDEAPPRHGTLVTNWQAYKEWCRAPANRQRPQGHHPLYREHLAILLDQACGIIECQETFHQRFLQMSQDKMQTTKPYRSEKVAGENVSVQKGPQTNGATSLPDMAAVCLLPRRTAIRMRDLV